MGGVQRATKFARYLPDFGWQPHIITVKDIYYYAFDKTLLKEVGHLPISRAGSLDPARLARIFQLKKAPSSVRPAAIGAANKTGGPIAAAKIFRRVFYPDSKILWTPFAERHIRRKMKKTEFHAIYSTSPPVSAHLLAAKFGLPWIADFRDYWSSGDRIYAPTEWHKRKSQRIMSKITERASKIIAVSEPIAETIRSFASEKNRNKVVVIPNGFDPADLEDVQPIKFDRFTISYLGSITQKSSPGMLFDVIDALLREQPEWREKIQFYFVGKHFEFNPDSVPVSMRDIVHFQDYVPHNESLAYALGSQALLFLRSKDINKGMMTGKIFEYLGTGKPILALVPKHISAHELLRKMPNCYIAEPDQPARIRKALGDLLREHFGRTPDPQDSRDTPDYLLPYVRQKQTEQLANLLNECVGA